MVLEYIDWKESYFYRQLIVRHAEDALKWDTEQLMRDDEVEFLHRLIRGYRFKKPNFNLDELMRMIPSMTKKCYNSIEMVYKEILTEAYWRKEYEQMRLNDPYVCRIVPKGNTAHALKIFTLENLLNRVTALKAFRKDIRSFLELVHQRELILKQMHLAVDAI